ncbi:MFS multidrug resistance transporter [Lepidopterella palustris CBS 459.81]|uniref:MFS multidrug resistance transporter n=1 Tax=Lepidopterella palustris CBS 459.81 TaxID=1314670 RepID=A0A8E2DWR7_9PEZI|nr:MFS multidrug resistance transporter [Lepidopterella palustris CBS 459.81]
MAPDVEKAEDAGADNTTKIVLGEEKGDLKIQQGASETSSEEQQPGAQPNGVLTKATSKAGSVARALETVPRSQRRGLLGRFAIIPEVTNPYNYGNRTKWWMTIIVSFAAITSSTGSSIFYPALAEVAHDLHTTPTVTNLSLAFYMLAMGFTPLWWSAFSEKHGRRTIYLISFSLFLVFSCISAVSVNIAMLIVFRILSGGAAASVQAVGAGTVADIWEPKERGRAMGVFYLGPLCGPGLAPIIGGALTQGLHWRSTLWFLTIFGGVMLILILFCLPETVERRESNIQEPDGINKGIERIVNPVKVLAMLRYPPIIVAVWSAAIAFGAMFVLNVSIQADFDKPPYNFTIIEVGLVYLAPTLGYAVSSLLGGRWIDYIMAREARKAGRYDENGKLKYLPEDRMKENIWLAATLYPAALIWYGWSVEKNLHWIVACVACVFFGLGMMLVMGAVTTMLTEFTPKRSSSGIAINNFVRNILSCTGAVVTQPLIDAMGTGWMCTLIGLFAFVTGNAAIMALKTWGPQWRVTMEKKLNAQK